MNADILFNPSPDRERMADRVLVSIAFGDLLPTMTSLPPRIMDLGEKKHG